MKRIALFLLIAVVAISSADAQKVKRKIQKEKDGYSWYLLKQGDIRGAENNRGTIIIPLEKKSRKLIMEVGISEQRVILQKFMTPPGT